MNVWFFYERWKDHRGHAHPVYYAVTEVGGHVTDGSTASQAIYMAYDLVACIREFEQEETYIIRTKEEAEKLLCLSDIRYVGRMTIDVELCGKRGWVRKGDGMPRKQMPPRFRMLERAFGQTYPNQRKEGISYEMFGI